MIPNLYIGNGCFTISIHFKLVVCGSRQWFNGQKNIWHESSQVPPTKKHTPFPAAFAPLPSRPTSSFPFFLDRTATPSSRMVHTGSALRVQTKLPILGFSWLDWVEGKAARSTTWGSMLKKLFESTNSILMGSKIVWHIKGYFACKAFSDGGSTKGSNIFLGHVVWFWEGIAAFISRETKLIGWYSCWKQVGYFTVPDGTMDHYYLEPDGHPCINGWLSIGSLTKSLRWKMFVSPVQPILNWFFRVPGGTVLCSIVLMYPPSHQPLKKILCACSSMHLTLGSTPQCAPSSFRKVWV